MMDYYTTIDEIPDETMRSLAETLVKGGYISYRTGRFEFPLTEDMLNVLLVIARLGVF